MVQVHLLSYEIPLLLLHNKHVWAKIFHKIKVDRLRSKKLQQSTVYTVIIRGSQFDFWEIERVIWSTLFFVNFFLSRRVHAWHFFLFHEKKVFFFGSRAWIFLGSGTVACIFFQNHSPLPQKSNDPCPQRQKFLSLSLWRSMEYANQPSEVLQWKIPRNSFLDNFLVSSRPWFFKIIQKDKEIEDLLNLK